MILRPDQHIIDQEIEHAWSTGNQNVLAVACCGFGKTVLLSDKMNRFSGASVAIAHRQELVGQMSRTIARYGVKHRIIGPSNVVRGIIQTHIAEFGRDFYDPNARCAVAGVDTLVSWAKPDSPHHSPLMRWAPQVGLWITDEAHHLIDENKWGRAIALFQNAKGLGVTATPERADGKGLGRHNDGVFDTMVVGPGLRDTINAGFLTDYRIFCPPNDLDLSSVSTGVDGDYIRKQLAMKTRSSTIMGHVVEHYLRIAPGKLGVTFAPDVDTATTFSKMFNEAGVPAEVVSANTPDRLRVEILKRFANRQILMLVNVDLFGEGFDLPAMEVCIMARATMSYGLYVQQFCRPMRWSEGKDRAIIIDHVGNVVRHGLPDKPRVWTLDRREKRSSAEKDEGIIPLKTCLNPVCLSPYEAVYPVCPYCGWIPVPSGRSAPEQVDGDLHELSPEVLAAMRGEIAKIVDKHPDDIRRMMQHAGHNDMVAHSAAKRHRERQVAINDLRETIAWYGAYRRAAGEPDRMSQRRFYFTFGIDVLSAQTLGRAEAEELTGRINKHLGRVTV